MVLRAANQNLNDCQWQSYLNVTQTAVAPSRDSLRSQSVLLNLSEKTSSTLPGVEEVLQLGKKQGKYSFRKVNIVLTVSGRMRTKIKNLFEITTIPKRFFWRRRRDLNPRYPFGVYTISNRARSASYATSPSAVGSCRLAYNTRNDRNCQGLFFKIPDFFCRGLTACCFAVFGLSRCQN